MYPLPPCRAADRDIFPVQSYLSQFAAEVLLQECQGKRHCTVPWVSAASTCHANSPHFVVLPYLQLVIVLIALITAILLTLISEPTHPLFEPTGSHSLVHLSVYLVVPSSPPSLSLPLPSPSLLLPLPFSFLSPPLPSLRTVCLIVVGVTTSNSQ